MALEEGYGEKHRYEHLMTAEEELCRTRNTDMSI
jgi:hypothetical protein